MKISKTKKQAFSYLKGYKSLICILLSIILIYTLLTSISPVVYGKMFDQITNPNKDVFLHLLFIYAVILLFTTLFNFTVRYTTEYLGNIIFKESQHNLYKKILALKVSDFERFDLGELMTNLNSDIGTIIKFDVNLLSSIVTILLNSIVPFGFMLFISRKLTILAILFIPATFFIYYAFKNKKKRMHKELQENQDRLNSFTVSTIENTSGIKAYRLESLISNKFHVLVDNIFHSENRLNIVTDFITMSNEWNNLAYQIISLILYYYLLQDGTITLGTMVSFGMYVNRLFSSISMIQGIQLDEQEVYIALQRVNRLIKLPTETDCDRNTEVHDESPDSPVSLAISKIHFQYDDSAVVLNDLTLMLDKPGLYSIVGNNGCGKTTLYKLLVKFYAYTNGSISLNHNNYDSCPISYIRTHITYVQKDPFILDDSLFNNITLYDPVTKEQIADYCKLAGLSTLIASLPDGIQSKISKDTLSSGQRQKIGFARALAHQADLMLFDEITSDLDGSAELSFVQVMKELSKKSIVISISHRPQTIFESDRIFVLNNGQIVESGTFDELNQIDTHFSTLFYTNSSSK